MTAADRWTCAHCGAIYPVTILARDCEARHAREANDQEGDQPT